MNSQASFHKRLTAYATAAGAAGFGLLVAPQNLDAQIVYTPADVTINAGEALFIDLDQDGTNEFKVSNSPIYSAYSYCARLGVAGQGGPGANIEGYSGKAARLS